MAKSKKWIALLRAVLPATHKKMSMQQLRESCEKTGLENVSTHAASGNLLFSSRSTKQELLTILNGIIASYDLENSVILRTPAQLKSVISSAPFADAIDTRPNLLLVYFYDKKLPASQIEELELKGGPERMQLLGRELCIDYKEGVARSKLTPKLIERHLGQSGTARNWNAVNKLVELSAK